ncbi:MAG: DUF4290 domain-containing protein [Paludibacteraceae bacterium]|nr:DUF4290 domain-containing protein [Paludibacteraceae bacterium]
MEQEIQETYSDFHTDYNTSKEPIELRGYGRNIQKMVDHCLGIEDRAERTRCAYSIIKTMERIRPMGYSQNTLWDHIYFISGYRLDIDYPNGYVPQKLGGLTDATDTIPYPKSRFRFRHYGNNIQLAIQKAMETEEEESCKKLTLMIANQMKRCYILYNKDTVTDNKIFDDLREMSQGKLDIKNGEFKLVDAQTVLAAPVATPPAKSKKKKKKK